MEEELLLQSTDSGRILDSEDGLSWTQQSIYEHRLFDITYGNDLFVAVGDGAIFTSSDGIAWTQVSSAKENFLVEVAYGSGTFVAVGLNGNKLSSSDGITWTRRLAGTNISLSGAAYGKGSFVVVGSGGTILQSDPLSDQLSTDVKANNSDGPVTLHSDNILSVTVALQTSSYGINADWWLVAYTPFGLFYYTYPDTWNHASDLDNIRPAHRGPLFDLSPVEVLNITWLPIGTYTFYFGVDTKMNGNIDFNQLYVDYVSLEAIDLRPFKELASGTTSCIDIKNRLFLIDREMVLWDTAGSCPDSSYSMTLFGKTPDTILCAYYDSIAGPVKTCNDETKQAFFDIILENLSEPDLGLGTGHTVEIIPF